MQKADALRYYVMKHFGGELWTPSAGMHRCDAEENAERQRCTEKPQLGGNSGQAALPSPPQPQIHVQMHVFRQSHHAPQLLAAHPPGLYLDVDTECWREGSNMLEGADLVFQGHHQGEAAANGMLASVPGHPFWDGVISLMKQRRRERMHCPLSAWSAHWAGLPGVHLSVTFHSPPTSLYADTVAHETHVIAVLNGTGPLLLRDSILAYFNQTLGGCPPSCAQLCIRPVVVACHRRRCRPPTGSWHGGTPTTCSPQPDLHACCCRR